MKRHYTDRVPFEIAKELSFCGYPQCKSEDQYAGWKYNMSGQLTTAPYAEHYAAPTYSEVLDWLLSKKVNISIYFTERKKWSSDVITKRAHCYLVSDNVAWHDAANAAIKRSLGEARLYLKNGQ